MAEIIEMPKLSDTMEEGVIVAWHKQIGDEVESGELLAEIETDKATMDLESFFDGVLLYREVEENGAVPVGKLLAIIGSKDDNVDALVAEYKASANGNGAETEVPAEEPPAAEETAASPTAEVPAAAEDGRIKASPLAKAMARERGIALGQITGTGPEGRIIKRDIEEFAPTTTAPATPATAPVAAPPVPEPLDLPTTRVVASGTESFDDIRVTQMRKAIARRLVDSKNNAPHFYLTMAIDMDEVWTARKAMNELSPVKLSFNDIIIKAVAMALRQHPECNSHWMGDQIRVNHHIHIGMAVAVDGGLIVPVIRHADNLSLSQIATESRRLAGLAREGKLAPEEYTGGTFSVSNLGMFGIEEFTAVINPPEAGIIAIGAIREEPVVKNGEIVPGRTMRVTMSCDHKVIDGAVGAAFLKTLKELLENPLRMMI
ncbi:MAG: pyruvate dehydrogenase complex dihydrolipoamide acetyltransferase [Bacteroidota bacterium]